MRGARQRLVSAIDRTEAEHGEQDAAPVTVTATEAQNEFGRVLDLASRDEVVVITRHNAPRAVLISARRYQELAGTEFATLDALSAEFDAFVARQQSPSVRDGTARGFRATPREMGKAAVKAAQRSRTAGDG